MANRTGHPVWIGDCAVVGHPDGPSSYILARKLGGDTSTMASMIVFQTLVGLGTLLAVLTLWQVVTGIRLT